MTRSRLMVSVVALAAVFTTLGGCANEKQKALEKEAAQLRERNQQVEKQLADSESDKARLQQELDSAKMAGTQSPGASYGGGGGGGGDTVITVAGDVAFGSGSATVKADAKKILDKIASDLNGRYASHRIKIGGHTDSDPLNKSKKKWGSNEKLSEARAEAVRDYLASKGVSESRMSAVGYGSSQPKGSKKDSRRVEIVVVGNGN
ncbi:MAG TPA: OmpA family protein [Phycisphaerales bacterium]|nr:OmpA family protein [Phycisphaerales bacterium]